MKIPKKKNNNPDSRFPASPAGGQIPQPRLAVEARRADSGFTPLEVRTKGAAVASGNLPLTGFTLVEALVATAVFAFVISSIIGVYLSVLQLDRKARAQSTVSQNARFIMEFLAKEVRNGKIDYAAYPSGLATTTSDIYVLNQAGEAEYINLVGTNLVLTKNSASSNINSNSVKVTKAEFFVQPAGDPFNPAKTYNTQPHVTVVLELTSNYGSRTGDISVMNLQSTFATRSYPARPSPTLFSCAILPDPIGWWKLDDGSGSTAIDSSVNGNNGTLIAKLNANAKNIHI